MTEPRRIDLDAAATARREAIGEAIEVVFRGATYTLPVELPLDVMEYLSGLLDVATSAEGDPPAEVLERGKTALEGALGKLFGPDQWEQFKQGRPSLADMWVLFNSLVGAYGVTLGEALGPIASSLSGGPLSALISNATTGSTPADSGAPATGT